MFAGLEIKTAIGTSLAVIAVNCLGGLIGQLRYLDFDRRLASGFLLAAMAGMLAGMLLAKRLTASSLQQGFAWCVVVMGGVLVARNLLLLAGSP